MKPTTVYILGPMRGKHKYNFPAFDAMAEKIWARGFGVINPAQLDREAGFDPDALPADHDYSNLPSSMTLEDIVNRDLDALKTCNAYVALEGWENSSGAKAEKAVLDWKKAVRLDPDTLEPYPRFADAPPGWPGPQPTAVSGCAGPTRQQDSPTGIIYPVEMPAFPVLMGRTVGEVCGGPSGPPGDKGPPGINPKDLCGQKKPPMTLIPTSSLFYLSRVMELGAKKYTPFNWRNPATPVRMTVYLAAAWRHLLQILDGENNDPESNNPHAAHAMACFAIILDAQACGTLVDDRPLPGAASKVIAELTTK